MVTGILKLTQPWERRCFFGVFAGAVSKSRVEDGQYGQT
jgi:hypothetical protein